MVLSPSAMTTSSKRSPGIGRIVPLTPKAGLENGNDPVGLRSVVSFTSTVCAESCGDSNLTNANASAGARVRHQSALRFIVFTDIKKGRPSFDRRPLQNLEFGIQNLEFGVGTWNEFETPNSKFL